MPSVGDQRHQDDLVQVPEDRHEVGDQVKGRERVGRDQQGRRPGMPVRAGIAPGYVERVNVALDRACPVSRRCNFGEAEPSPMSWAAPERRDFREPRFAAGLHVLRPVPP